MISELKNHPETNPPSELQPHEPADLSSTDLKTHLSALRNLITRQRTHLENFRQF